MGNTVFAAQHNRQCFTGENAENTYKKHGIATNCQGGIGGSWASDVYKIVRCPGNVITVILYLVT
jgi:hypothetical protein